jgi:hypothetical protein
MTHQLAKTILLFAAITLLSACAAGPNSAVATAAADGAIAGFWSGLWHGIIAPVTFILSLFMETVSMYEVHNNGGWYNAGFILGVAMLFSGSGGAAGRRRR